MAAARTMTFRRAGRADGPALAQLAATAFRDAYAALDDPADIEEYVAEHFNLTAIETLLSHPASTTLLAEVKGELAGYAVLTRGPAPGSVRGPAPIQLARFYLATPYIGRGHGAALMAAVHAEARRQQAGTVWLGVYDRNARAIAFYERSGFVRVGSREFMFGGRLHTDPVYAAAVRDDA